MIEIIDGEHDICMSCKNDTNIKAIVFSKSSIGPKFCINLCTECMKLLIQTIQNDMEEINT